MAVAAVLLPALPASALAGPAGSTSAPMIRASGVPEVGSFNWSGYAVTSDTSTFTYVHSRWVQPAITCDGKKAEFTSNWVGLDGAFNGTVEQDGSAGACKGPQHLTPVYNAWYELFPANEVVVFAISPGDVMDATVSYTQHQFTLTIADLTSGRTATHTATCAACKRSSAEWIIERPASCKTVDPLTGCQIDRLANFKTTTMTQNTAQVLGGKISGVTGFDHRLRIVMIDPLPDGGYQPLDAISPPSSQSFTATWLATGNPVPIQL